MDRRLRTELSIVGSIVIGLYLLITYTLEHHPVFQIKERSFVETKMDSMEMVYQKRKLKKLESSYCEMMSKANISADTGALVEASEHYFLAKTIFPERIEPRLNLAKTFCELCYDTGFFCYEARKEIRYAHFYIADTPHYKTELFAYEAKIKDFNFEYDIEFME